MPGIILYEAHALDFDGLKPQAINILELHKFTRHYIRGVERVFVGSVQGIGDV